MKFGVKRLFVTCFVLAIGALFLWTSHSRPSILVIHAQNPAHPLVMDVNKGIKQVLTKRTFYHTYFHYMDIKNQASKAEHINRTAKAMEVIEALKPDYIILVGDITQTDVGIRLIDREDIKVIYCHINQDPSDYGYDKARNVIGVKSALPLQIINDLLLTNIDLGNFSNNVKVTFVGDQSPVTDEIMDSLRTSHKWHNVRLQKDKKMKTFDEWKQIILSIKGKQDVILVTHYENLERSAEDIKLVPPREVAKWTSANAKVPLIGLSGAFVRDGGGIAIAPSGIEQGERAARMVETLIENDIYIDQMSSVENDQFLVYLRRYISKDQKRLYVPKIYEAFSKAVHHYYE